MSADEYVPDEEQVRAWCREGAGDYPDVMNEWLDRFLARVRRDAKAEAFEEGWKERAKRDMYRSRTFLHESPDAPGPPPSLNPYRATHYPEETP